MKILFIGDIVGKAGRLAAARLLPRLISRFGIDLCVANGENAAAGFGLTPKIFDELRSLEIGVVTSGNHIWKKKEIYPVLDEDETLLRPMNYPPGVPGHGSCTVSTPGGDSVGVLNLMGRVFMYHIDCPFRAAEAEVARLREHTNTIIVDFHAEATSEKIAMGWFLDGKVSAVLGTHTHVQTADETVLPQGTAYITDVGMTGPMNSVIGVKTDIIIDKYLYQIPKRFDTAKGPAQVCGVVVDIDSVTGKAKRILRIRMEDEER
ncbi:MAG: TIGR00282 family metallophosphoesterase [bacterium]|nr:TIGR00282 family metallophosphoesterase [bacterium]